jgi:hypothetical protein
LPVTIGVFGDWGSEKFSIHKVVEKELIGDSKERYRLITNEDYSPDTRVKLKNLNIQLAQ